MGIDDLKEYFESKERSGWRFLGDNEYKIESIIQGRWK